MRCAALFALEASHGYPVQLCLAQRGMMKNAAFSITIFYPRKLERKNENTVDARMNFPYFPPTNTRLFPPSAGGRSAAKILVCFLPSALFMLCYFHSILLVAAVVVARHIFFLFRFSPFFAGFLAARRKVNL